MAQLMCMGLPKKCSHRKVAAFLRLALARARMNKSEGASGTFAVP